VGYEVPRRTGLVDFEEGHDYCGAEVTIYLDQPLGFVFEMQRQFLAAATAEKGEDLDLVEELVREFASRVLSSWNLENDGEPIAATAEEFYKLPAAFANTLIGEWLTASTRVTGPLDERSSAGDGSVVPWEKATTS